MKDDLDFSPEQVEEWIRGVSVRREEIFRRNNALKTPKRMAEERMKEDAYRRQKRREALLACHGKGI